MPKKPLAVIMGVTGNMAFAAGCVLLALERHSPALRADIIVYTDDSFTSNDSAIFRRLGARLEPLPKEYSGLSPHYLALFTQLGMARFEGFKLLQEYSAVLYLDADIAVQGDIAPLLEYGPFGVALEDPGQQAGGGQTRAGVNITAPIPGFDAAAPNLNSGVLLLRDTLPDPMRLYNTCRRWVEEYGGRMAFADQAVVNLLAHAFLRDDPALVSYIPHSLFNSHPCSPEAQNAVLVHAFGPAKFWSDALMARFFPEWTRDYARWLALGGGAWQGRQANFALAEGGPYAMLQRLAAAPATERAYSGWGGAYRAAPALAPCGGEEEQKL